MSGEPDRREAGPGNGAASAAGFTPLDQAFDASSLYALRAAVAAHASAAGLSRNRVYDVTAAAHELAANVIVHGTGTGKLRLWAEDGYLYCAASDDGPAPPVDGTAPWPVEPGHGLWLVGQVAEQVDISREPAGATVTVRFSLSPG